MGDRIAEVIVLAEDLRSGRLVQRDVERALNPRGVRLRIAPAGKQSAYDWVIQSYPVEMKSHRNRVSKGANLSAVAVHVDADNLTVQQRSSQLAEALRAQGEPPRGPGERIAVIVPRRNMETWIHGLTAVPVDEQYDFKRDEAGRIAPNTRQRERMCDERIGPAAQELHRLSRPNAPSPPDTLPALILAIEELRRLER